MSIANKIVVGLVGLTVMAVIFSAMLPIMGEVTSAETTFTNEGYYRMSKIDTSSPDYVLTWTASDNKIINANGEDITVPWDSTYPLTIIALENYGVRYTVTLSTQTVTLDLFGPQQNVITSKTIDATITLSEGTMTVSSTGAIDQTYSYDIAYVIDANGDYTMKKGNQSAYVLGDSDIFATGRTQVTIGSNVWLNINVAGTIDDGFNATVFSSEDYTTSNYVVNDEVIYGYIDAYKFDNVQFDITATGGTATATYSQVIVPYQITAEKETHPDGPTTAILNMLPIIIGAGLLLGAIAFMIVTRK